MAEPLADPVEPIKRRPSVGRVALGSFLVLLALGVAVVQSNEGLTLVEASAWSWLSESRRRRAVERACRLGELGVPVLLAGLEERGEADWQSSIVHCVGDPAFSRSLALEEAAARFVADEERPLALREACAEALSQRIALRSPETAHCLLSCVPEVGGLLEMHVRAALLKIRPSDAHEPTLLRLCRSGAWLTRAESLKVLRRLPRVSQPLLESARLRLDDDDEVVRAEAVRTLLTVIESPEQRATVRERARRDSSFLVRDAATSRRSGD